MRQKINKINKKFVDIVQSYRNLQDLALINHKRLNAASKLLQNQEDRIAKIEQLLLSYAVYSGLPKEQQKEYEDESSD